MDSMTLLNNILKWAGASDAAITAMGPTLTIVIAYIVGIGVAQGVKFPLSKILPADWYGYVVRIVGVTSAFGFAHWGSNHLTVPVEFAVGVTQPIVYALLQLATEKYAPWAASIFFKGVTKP